MKLFKHLRDSLYGFAKYERELIKLATVTPYGLAELREYEREFVRDVLRPALELAARRNLEPRTVLTAIMCAARRELKRNEEAT